MLLVGVAKFRYAFKLFCEMSFFSPLTKRKISQFKANSRAWASLRLFMALGLLCVFAPMIANDKPLFVWYDGGAFFPIAKFYPETAFGGEFETQADYKDEFVADLIDEKGWAIWPPVRFSWDTINYNLDVPAPSPPSAENILGTDDRGRDVFARMLYGLRISLAFGLILAPISAIIGILAGAIQGYYGGLIDLSFQRVIEIWSSMPRLLVLIIFAALFTPGFWTLLFILLLFSWVGLVDVVRAESLRARSLDYVRAAKAIGVAPNTIMLRHVLPNALVAAVSYIPFVLTEAIVALASLDFLGIGMPAGSPSLGELLSQGKNNLYAPWLGLSGFFALACVLTLLVFIGEGVRDAIDPRRQER